MTDTWQPTCTFIVYTDLGERLLKYWQSEMRAGKSTKIDIHRLTSLNASIPSYIPFRDIDSHYYRLDRIDDGSVVSTVMTTKIGDIADVDILILFNGWTVDSAGATIGGFHSCVDDYFLESSEHRGESGYMPSILSLNKRSNGEYYSQSPLCYSRAVIGKHDTSGTYWDWYLNLLRYEGLIRETPRFRMLPTINNFGNALGFPVEHLAPAVLQ